MKTPLFNTTLADSRGISQEDQNAMQKIYEFLHQILARPSMHCKTPQQAVELVQALEYTLQLFWKFPVDRAFHNYWVDTKGCTCPKVDNKERAGSGYFIVSENCPYHSIDRKADTWEDGRFNEIRTR